VITVHELKKVIAEAEILRILDLKAVERLLARSHGRRGVARLRTLLPEPDSGTRAARSRLERRFLAMCERANIPRPEVNRELDLGNEQLIPDFLWQDARLIVETDGRETHGTTSAFEEDRRRDQVLSAAGWQVVRCTWRQVQEDPARLASTLRTILGRRA